MTSARSPVGAPPVLVNRNRCLVHHPGIVPDKAQFGRSRSIAHCGSQRATVGCDADRHLPTPANAAVRPHIRLQIAGNSES